MKNLTNTKTKKRKTFRVTAGQFRVKRILFQLHREFSSKGDAKYSGKKKRKTQKEYNTI